MALGAGTIVEVQTGGSDTLNAGMFDPGQTAGMFTDGAATVANTAAPVFTSASYNFVAGDVGAWVYIATGTNWIAGWYKIASVAANAATLNGTIGQGVIAATYVPTTVVGCASVASPSSATWTIDYSQQAAAQFAYTDLASVGAGLLVSSVAKPFAKQQVGNGIVITGGTNFTTGRYVIASVAVGVATVVGAGNITTGAGVNGTGGQGGALASPGMASGSGIVTGNIVFIKTGTYTIASATPNIATGCFSSAVVILSVQGYQTVRGDFGTAPLLQASGISTFTLFTSTGADATVYNVNVDGAGLTASIGFSANGIAYKCAVLNCTGGGFTATVGLLCSVCRTTGCSSVAAFGTLIISIDCIAHDNTVTGFIISSSTISLRCIADSNSGASSDGFSLSGSSRSGAINCVAYNNGRDGFRIGDDVRVVQNCIAENNGGVGIGDGAAAQDGTLLINNATYNNTGGSILTTAGGKGNLNLNPIVGSGSFFVDAANQNFALNNTSSAGALARATGFPGVLPLGGTGYIDVGVLQHQDPSGGGGGIFY